MFKIFFGNVSFNTTTEQVREICKPHFEVDEVVIAQGEDGKPKGYGFVLTREEQAALNFLRRIGKPVLDGRRVYFKESYGKKKPKPVTRQRPSLSRRPFRAAPVQANTSDGYVGATVDSRA